jgi:signal peptidase I
LSKKEGALSLPGSAFIELLQAVLNKGTPFRFRAEGFSMYPFIRNGDVVTLSPLFDAVPRLGDVIAFVRPGTNRLIVHRVIGKRGSSFLTKGDNLSSVDGFIPEANILGNVTKVERNGKEVFSGIGPERILIALFSRRGVLFPLLLPVWKLVRPIMRRWVK